MARAKANAEGAENDAERAQAAARHIRASLVIPVLDIIGDRWTLLLLAALVSACTAAPGPGRTPSDDTVALLLPDAKTARYETFDRPLFEARVAELGDYRVLYANADQDAAKQQQQAESALTAGAGVLVLDPVDANAAVSIVTSANAKGVPVISYDRLVAGGDLAYYISFDNEKVGVLQAEAFVEGVRAAGVRSKQARGYGNDLTWAVLDEVIAIAGEHGAAPASVALAWLLARPGITAPIVGASRAEQLAEPLAALSLALSAGDIARLDRVSGGL